MVVPLKHLNMIIFSRKTPWVLGSTILGNPTNITLHILTAPTHDVETWVAQVAGASGLIDSLRRFYVHRILPQEVTDTAYQIGSFRRHFWMQVDHL